MESLSNTEFILRWLEGVPGSPRKSQKEGQEDRGEVKELGGSPPTSSGFESSMVLLAFLLALPWGSWNSLKPPQDELCIRQIPLIAFLITGP